MEVPCWKVCYCCLNEGDKVSLTMKNFDPMPVRYAMSGQVQLLIGACTPCAGAAFFCPSTMRPCVYYKIDIQEEQVVGYDDDGREKTIWNSIYKDQQFADFYISDVNGMKIWVNGSNPGFCKRFSETASGSSGWSNFNANNLPPGIQQIVNASKRGFLGGWGGFGANNRYRYTESSFDIGESVAVLSRIADGMDQYTGQPVKVAQLFVPEGDFFSNSKMSWSEWDITAVQELAGMGGAVIVSDSKILMREAMAYRPPVFL